MHRLCPPTFVRVAVLALAATAPELHADTWTVEPGVRSTNLTSTCTLPLPDGAWRHYYHGNVYRTSPDGLTFSAARPLNGLVTPPGFFDRNPAVLADGPGYVMIFERVALANQSVVVGLYRATSTDGLAWAADPTPVLTPIAEEAGFMSVPELVAFDAGLWRLYYVVRGDVVASATTTDRGRTWTREGRLSVTGLAAGERYVDPDLIRTPAGHLRMFAAIIPATIPTGIGNQRIRAAVSDDGRTFHFAPYDLIGVTNNTEAKIDPDVVALPGGGYRMYFGAGASAGGPIDLHSATAPALAAPSVTSPASATGTVGAVFSLQVTATNSADYFRVATGGLPAGLVLDPATGVISGTPSAAGTFTFSIRAANADAASAAVPLTLTFSGTGQPPPAGTPGPTTSRLVNVSVRARSGSGAGVLIAGFTLTGIGTKPLLIRGIGPALIAPPFSLAGALVDARLELYSGPNRTAENDNWSAVGTEAGEIAAAAARFGAFPLAAGSRDAAALATLPTGGYTMQVAGVGGTAGTALAEIYDADPNALAAGSRLSNVSARTEIGAGVDVLIAGFTIAGTGSQRLLVRAVGPSLARFSVSGLLADPRVEVFSGAAVIAANDNWAAQSGGLTSTGIQEAAASAGAFPLDPNSRDAALLLSVPPGSYTAQVSGVGPPTGVALIEIYEIAPVSTPGPARPPGGSGSGGGGSNNVQATAVSSTYRTAPGGLTGWLASGQSADLMLSGFGFGESGGPLQFNHPRGIASDGTRLYVSDGHNNRVLVWLRAPDGNTPPDFVLGQATLNANVPGTGLHQLNWPGQVSVSAGGRVVVADTYNDRLLVWREAPVRNGQPADFEIRHSSLRWPWGVWTDGTRLVASSTGGGPTANGGPPVRAILVWSSFPGNANTPPDFTLADPAIGTPRTITSDGSFLMVGDHNANGNEVGNWVWKTFPTSARRYDYFLREPSDANGPWMQGAMNADGKLVVLGRNLNLWNGIPDTAATAPALIVDGYSYHGGDGSGVALALGRTYVVAYNDNRVTGYRSLPTNKTARPDFVVGSPGLEVNTLTTTFFITNPVPATDGARLFVSSDFDRTLSVWNRIPDESAAKPDWRYTLPFAPWDNALSGDTLVLAGQRQIMGWKNAPRAGEMPEINYRDRIGSVVFREIRGVALDAANLYVADFQAGKVYVWRGLPAANSEPFATLEVPGVTRLSSDGTWLVATQTERQSVTAFEVAKLAANASGMVIGGQGRFNLPQGACVAKGQLFIANTNFNQVHAWRRVEDAVAGRNPDVVLGDPSPAAAPRATDRELFWPGVPAFDGNYLWLGEFKFSGRLLRFSVR